MSPGTVIQKHIDQIIIQLLHFGYKDYILNFDVSTFHYTFSNPKQDANFSYSKPNKI